MITIPRTEHNRLRAAAEDLAGLEIYNRIKADLDAYGDPRLSTLLGVLKALGISLRAGKATDTKAA
mgnify:FL=1